MVNIDESFEMRLKKDKEMFQILVDFKKLNEFKKKSNEMSVYDVIADTKIFHDQKKGDVASEKLLKEKFPNKTEEEIIKEILLKGDCQIPTFYKKQIREKKKKQVINYIVESALNPQTKNKYTQSMIQSEVDKIKYNFDTNRSSVSQAEDVIKILRKQMPISIEKVKIEIEIPVQYLGAFYGPFRNFGKIESEKYDNSGNLILVMQITESQNDEVIEFIKRKTNNEASYFIRK